MQLHLKRFYIFLFSLLVVFAAGCRGSTPVHNIEGASVVTGKTNASMNDVDTAILRAGRTMGWNMNVVGPGQIIGTLKLRKHVAVVDIKYNLSTYSIMYKDSTGLDYDGKNIHGNYNGWIKNLDRAIKVQLDTL